MFSSFAFRWPCFRQCPPLFPPVCLRPPPQLAHTRHVHRRRPHGGACQRVPVRLQCKEVPRELGVMGSQGWEDILGPRQDQVFFPGGGEIPHTQRSTGLKVLEMEVCLDGPGPIHPPPGGEVLGVGRHPLHKGAPLLSSGKPGAQQTVMRVAMFSAPSRLPPANPPLLLPECKCSSG